MIRLSKARIATDKADDKAGPTVGEKTVAKETEVEWPEWRILEH